MPIGYAIDSQQGSPARMPRVLPTTKAPSVPPMFRNSTTHPSPYLPPMPEMMQNAIRPTAVQTNLTRANATTSEGKLGPPTVAEISQANGKKFNTQPIIRGRLDEDTSPRPPAIALPPPEALGLVPSQNNNRGVHANPAGPPPLDTSQSGNTFGEPGSHFVSDSRITQAGTFALLNFDWFGLRQRCMQLGISSYRLEKTEAGQWRFACILPGTSGQSQRELEAVADSQTEAVSAVLEHLASSIASH